MNGPGKALVALLAGILPAIAVHAAYAVNLAVAHELVPEYSCVPYLDGCVSISRAARSGPGLFLFRAIMLPSAVLLFTSWYFVRNWLDQLLKCDRRTSWLIAGLGMTGAVFLVFYVTWLGTEGDWYRWLRRYGVVFYFGGTALAQLLLVRILWPARKRIEDGSLDALISLLATVVSLQWFLGVLSVFKRLVFENPGFIDRLENMIEWWFALAMSLGFIVIGWMMRRAETRLKTRS